MLQRIVASQLMLSNDGVPILIGTLSSEYIPLQILVDSVSPPRSVAIDADIKHYILEISQVA